MVTLMMIWESAQRATMATLKGDRWMAKSMQEGLGLRPGGSMHFVGALPAIDSEVGTRSWAGIRSARRTQKMRRKTSTHIRPTPNLLLSRSWTWTQVRVPTAHPTTNQTSPTAQHKGRPRLMRNRRRPTGGSTRSTNKVRRRRPSAVVTMICRRRGMLGAMRSRRGKREKKANQVHTQSITKSSTRS